MDQMASLEKKVLEAVQDLGKEALEKQVVSDVTATESPSIFDEVGFRSKTPKNIHLP